MAKVTEDNYILRQRISSMKGEIDTNKFVNGEARIRANDFENDVNRLAMQCTSNASADQGH